MVYRYDVDVLRGLDWRGENLFSEGAGKEDPREQQIWGSDIGIGLNTEDVLPGRSRSRSTVAYYNNLK